MTNPHRLPRAVIPSHYGLRLEPDLTGASFTGSVQIEVDIVEPTDVVTLNAIELEIGEATITAAGVDHSPTIGLDDQLQRLSLQVDKPLAAGKATISISFTGILNDQLRGFYRSTFTDDDGTEHTIATTQFQSTDARRCFPCFDEPDFKATFGVTLVVEPHLLAIANTAQVEASEVPGGKIERTYAPTIKMSTYLVAFVVGPLEQTAPVDVDGVPVTIVHRPGQASLTSFGLEAAASALRYFTDYYGIAYPGDKIDMIAIPDFAFGAMENLGCITFREVLLVVDPDEATQPELQRVADVIAHELAHMWFGDLVTMAWWEGIWLNEAFATFMEMKATDHFKPEWQRWTNFGLSRTAAFDTDSLHSTRPIEFGVESPADAEAMFDILTYEKGAAVVRMLEQFLGEEVFRDGIRAYLTTHAYANTETADLWDALETTSGQQVRQIMETWIYQGGYPVVRLDEQGVLHQRRFTYQPASESTSTEVWSVPIRARDGAGVEQRILATGPQTDTPLAGTTATLNADGSGFYRSHLSDAHLGSIAADGPGDLRAVERFGLVDDTWALTTAGEIDPSVFMSLLDGFTAETDISVWQRILGSLSTLKHLAPEAQRPTVEALVARLVRPQLDQLGTEAAPTDTQTRRELRATLYEAMGTTGADPAALAHARSIHASSEADPSLLAAAVNVIAANGTAEDFDHFYNRFANAESPQEMQRYLYALADFGDPALGTRLAEATLTDDIRSQNGPYALARLLRNTTAGPAGWSFITANWDGLVAKFPSNSIARMLGGITALSTPELRADVESFLDRTPIAQGEKVIAQHRERLGVNAQFRARLADPSIWSV